MLKTIDTPTEDGVRASNHDRYSTVDAASAIVSSRLEGGRKEGAEGAHRTVEHSLDEGQLTGGADDVPLTSCRRPKRLPALRKGRPPLKHRATRNRAQPDGPLDSRTIQCEVMCTRLLLPTDQR